MIQWKGEVENFNRIFTSDLMLNLIRCIVWFIIIYTRYWRGDECCRYWVLAISVYLEWPKHQIRECGVDSIYLCFLQIIAIHNYYKQKPKLKVLTPNWSQFNFRCFKDIDFVAQYKGSKFNTDVSNPSREVWGECANSLNSYC